MDKILNLLVIFTMITACTKSPKVIKPVALDSENSTKIFEFKKASITPERAEHQSVSHALHEVKVLEVLPTQKYIYLKVKEGNEEFWLATSKKKVDVGGTYFYGQALLKTNFKSREYNRVFDRLYLVSSLVAGDHGHQTSSQPTREMANPKPGKTSHQSQLTIAQLIMNSKELDGKEIVISGTCTKINPSIMGRNWLHIQDGTKDDYDLVVTSNQLVAVGQEVTLKGVVGLERDFGSGYYYAVLVENGSIIN